MGTRTRYAPGTFAWVDLRTTDLAAARHFYAGLFGWAYSDTEAGTGDPYLVASVGGGAVAGMKQLGQRGGSSPYWLTYVAVAAADAAAARVHELGGTVHAEPFDRGPGRVTVVADPAGARLCLWHTDEGYGACRVDEPGCLTWHELHATDVPAATEFYAELFGWRIEPALAAAGTSARWLPYFMVASLDETLTRAEDTGGRRLAGPHDLRGDIRAGQAAVLRDPQGAEFGVLESRAGR